MKQNTSPLKWIYKNTRHFLPWIAFLCLLRVLEALLMIAMAFLSKKVLDSAADPKVFWTNSALLIGSIVAEVLISAASSMSNTHTNGRMTISLRNNLFSSIVRKKYPQVFDHHSGDLLNRFTSDADQVISGVTGILPSVTSMLTKIVVGIGALLLENYLFALAVVSFGFLLPLFGRMLSKRYKAMHKDVQRTEGKARSFLQECFQNIVVIKSFLSELPILKKLNEIMEDNYHRRIRKNLIAISINLSLYLLFSLCYYGIMIWGATGIVTGVITYGTLTYYLQLVSILRAPLQNISGVIPQYYAMIASAERLIELEEIPNEPPLPDDDGQKALRDEFSFLRVDHLAFAYRDELILRNCTFDVPRNGITAITGESGCGKSTLFKLLLGLYEPSGGSITVNGTRPVDASTRSLFSYVPQGNMILSGTIRENITLCNDKISDEAVKKAAKAAVIADLIDELPDGLDTVLSEKGAGLSEGQVQRLSIARALLFDAPILLLDESTSALDEKTETELLSNIKSMTDKTVLFITHRTTSLAVCDHIVSVSDKHFESVK